MHQVVSTRSCFGVYEVYMILFQPPMDISRQGDGSYTAAYIDSLYFAPGSEPPTPLYSDTKSQLYDGEFAEIYITRTKALVLLKSTSLF